MTTESSMPSYEEIWRKYDCVEQQLSAPLSERMLELANLTAGMHVLDIATGRGEPAIPAAKRVSPGGTVLGIDIDSSMLQIAQEKAYRAGITNLEFSESNLDTQNGIPLQFFDVAFARWGLMYFNQPVQALRTIRQALKNNAVFVAALWVDPSNASFSELPRSALSKIIPLPPTNHNIPGTFYYSDLNRFNDDLEIAGFTLQYSELFSVDVIEVSTNKELIDWSRAFGMSKMLKNVPMEKQLAWERELVTAAEPYRTKGGSIRLGGTSRIIVAT